MIYDERRSGCTRPVTHRQENENLDTTGSKGYQNSKARMNKLLIQRAEADAVAADGSEYDVVDRFIR